MARNKKEPRLARPQVEAEEELVGFFATMESGKCLAVCQALDNRLTEKERARNRRRPYYLRSYKMVFYGGGDWQGEEDVPSVMRRYGVTLEFWPSGLALHFTPYSCRDHFEDDDDGEV